MNEMPQILASLHEHSPVLVAAYDPQDVLQYANPAFREAFHVVAGERITWCEIMRRNFSLGRGTVIAHEDFEDWLVLTKARRGKVGQRAFETDLVGGRWLWMSETVQTDGWMLCVAADITGVRSDSRVLRQQRDTALRAAQVDELTGAASRRYVLERLADLIAASSRESLPGCVAILDIDHFKSINDRFGHHSGDVVLKDFARKVIDRTLRTDCLGRTGGEEFALVMPKTSVDEAAARIEGMLSTIRASKPLGVQFSYTFSAGIAEISRGGTALDLMARADAALYRAKALGRDRVERDETHPMDGRATA